MKRSIFLIITCLFLSLPSFSKVNVGAGLFVPFGLSSQGDERGGKNYLGSQPMIYASGMFAGFSDHLFLPELGIIPHLFLADEYSKMMYYLSFDLGYNISSRFLLRYGYGMFFTRISGSGEELVIDGSQGFAPEESSTSYNSTVNLGLEWALRSEYALRFQTYFFEMFNSDKRDVSYSLSLTYFL